MVVSEALCSAALTHVDIGKQIILSEIEKSEGARPANVLTLYKYAPFNTIRDAVMSSIAECKAADDVAGLGNHRTALIVVSSAAGGAGKTRTAMGVCKCLSSRGRRVLYIDAENDQSFSFFLTDQRELPLQNVRSLRIGELSAAETWVRTEGFDYFPPLESAADVLGVEMSVYMEMVRSIMSKALYDYIIVDTNAVYDRYKKELFRMAHRIVILIPDDAYAEYKTACLLRSMGDVYESKIISVFNGMGMADDRGQATIKDACDAVIERAGMQAGLSDLGEDPGITSVAKILEGAAEKA